jgi:transcription elongation factor Elf1
LARKHRRRVKKYRRSLPKYYPCPNCGVIGIAPELDGAIGRVSCATCGFKMEIPIKRYSEAIDVYNNVCDRYHAKRLSG